MAQIRSDDWHEVTRLAVSGSHGDFKLGVQRLSHRIEAGVAYNALVRPQVDGRRSVRIAMERASMRIEDPAGFVSDLMWEQREMYAALRKSYREDRDRAVAEADYLRAQCSDMQADRRRLRDERNRATALLEEATARVAELEAQLRAREEQDAGRGAGEENEGGPEQGLQLDGSLFSDEGSEEDAEASGSGDGGGPGSEDEDGDGAYSEADTAFLEDEGGDDDEGGPVVPMEVDQAGPGPVDVDVAEPEPMEVDAVVGEMPQVVAEVHHVVLVDFVDAAAYEVVVIEGATAAVALDVAAAAADSDEEVDAPVAGDAPDGGQNDAAEVEDGAAVDNAVDEQQLAVQDQAGPANGADQAAVGEGPAEDGQAAADDPAGGSGSDGEANQAFVEAPDADEDANQPEYGPILQGLEVDVFDPPPQAGKRKRKQVQGNRLIDQISIKKARMFQRYS